MKLKLVFTNGNKKIILDDNNYGLKFKHFESDWKLKSDKMNWNNAIWRFSDERHALETRWDLYKSSLTDKLVFWYTP